MSQQISIRSAHWPEDQAAIRSIRTPVFIEEQKVPSELEWDGLDEECYHWLAYAGERVIGCCRMQRDGHIGRMAVLPDYRQQQVGTALLAKAIEQARTDQLYECYLYAQSQALGFYQKAAFVIHGEEFLDAGIPHFTMRLTLSERRLLGQHGGDFAVKDLAASTLELIQQAKRQLRILSYDLDPRLYDNEPVVNSISQLARSSRYSEVKIMLVDPAPIIQHGHRLLSLHRRLPSNILLRRCTSQLHDLKNNLLIADGLGLICQSINDPDKVWANFNNRPVAENHGAIFDELWEHAVIDPDLRQLSL